MLESLKEYILNMGRWGWLVLVDVIGSGIGGYLDISQSANVPTGLWLGFLIAGLVIAPFWAFHKLRQSKDDLQSELNRIKDTLPSIEAKLQSDILQGVYIDVRNNGAKAEFKAQVEVLDSNDLDPKIELMPLWRRFSGYWEGKSTESVPIMRGESQRIKLVSFEQSTKANTGWLRLYKMNPEPAINNMLYIDTCTYPIFNPRGIMVPGFHLKTTITSHPSAKEGIVILECKIKADGDVNQLT